MSHPFQEPTFLCLTEGEVRKAYGDPGFTRELVGKNRFANTAKLLGNPLVAGFKDANIVPLRVPGFGPGKDRTATVDVHRKLAPLFTAAFEKIQAARLSYVLYTINGFYFRYQLNSDVKTALINRSEYADLKQRSDWNICFAERDLKNQAFDEIIPYKNGSVAKKHLLSNHAFGSAIDINAATNDFARKKPFDMPQRIVRIFESLGFYWGGYYHDYMHFEYERSSIVGMSDESPAQVLYPFSENPQQRESPLKYYFFNEVGPGGFFPLGKQQNLHAGVHLEPDAPAPRVPVKAAMPGYVVAARLMTPGKEGTGQHLLEATEGRPLGFVLVRHELTEPGATPSDPAHPLYSLCMHLAPPDWEGTPGDKDFEKVPWLASFLKMQHGAVVNLDPSTEDVGRTYWAQAPLDPEATSFKVRDREKDLSAKKNSSHKEDERILALTRPSPADISEAVEAFKQGSIVTFDRPLFPVAAGETLGFVAPGQAPAGPGYLHWELFSLNDAQGGLQFLTGKDEKLKELFQQIKEHRPDNFLTMPSDDELDAENEIEALLGSTHVPIVKELKHARYGKKLQDYFNDGKQFFSAQGTTEQPFTWPLRLTLENKYKYPGEADKPCTLEVLYKKAGKPLSQESFPLSPRERSTLEVTLNVPAAADSLALWSATFFADRVEVAADVLRAKRLESRTELFKTAAPHRWRNLLLDHLNEWTPKNLDLQLEARAKVNRFVHLEDTPDKTVEKVKKELLPLCWWARPATQEDPFGEVPVLGKAGDQKSLFGTGAGQLPEDAQLISMHPVTALWLMDILLEKESIALRKEWPPCTLKRDESTQQPPFLGLLYVAPQVLGGLDMRVVLVQHGYGTTDGANGNHVDFWLAPRGEGSTGQEPQKLCSATYVEGVAMQRLLAPSWGRWEVYATDGEGQRFEPAQKQATTFEVRKPQLSGQPFELGTKAGKVRPLATGTFSVREDCPVSLAGYVVFEYWKVPARAQPDLGVEPIPGSLAIPAVAKKPDKHRTAGGLKYEGDDIIGRENPKKNPSVTANFTFNEFLRDPQKNKVFEREEKDFRLAAPLALRLQQLRELCKPRPGQPKDIRLTVRSLHQSGRSLTVGPSSGSAADFQTLVKQLPQLPGTTPAELFSIEQLTEEKLLKIAYAPPSTTSGTLHLEFDPAPALGRLAAEALSDAEAGVTLHVRPRFVVPNVGHALHTSGKLTPVEGVNDLFAASAEALKAACGNDCLDIAADRALPPVARFEFGELQVTMSKGFLRTEVKLHGDANQWKLAAPTFKLAGAPLGKPGRGALVAEWPLMDKNGRIPRMWGQQLQFSAEVTQPDKVTSPPPPVTLSLEIKPSLEPLTWELQGKNVTFVCQGHFIPTDADFFILCERQDAATGQWENDTVLTSGIRYKLPGEEFGGRTPWGRCTATGRFEASILKAALKKLGGPFRISLRRRVNKEGVPFPLLGAPIEEPPPLELTDAELGP